MSPIQEQVTRALQGAVIDRVPFPHFYTGHVFPDNFYTRLMGKLAIKHDYHSEKFANRTFADSLGLPELGFMYGKDFFMDMLHLFKDELQAEYGGRKVQFTRDVRLIRDQQHYKIGPHTDAPWKVLSLLFYLPPDDSIWEYGTAIYTPKDPEFRCKGGPHHKFEDFEEIWRAPFMPNTCLGFWKTDHSFHGVPPIPEVVRRDVLLYNIYRKDIAGAP